MSGGGGGGGGGGERDLRNNMSGCVGVWWKDG